MQVRLRAIRTVLRNLTDRAHPLARISLFCLHGGAPGVDNVGEWKDYSARETTADQQRIEDFLESSPKVLLGDMLHVGVGNSSLAKRLNLRFDSILGISISNNELNRSKSLPIRNYKTHLLNKYDPQIVNRLPLKFDVIVDNNPSSFACCQYHFYCMMSSYEYLLKPDGMLISDAAGLSWTPPTNAPTWRLSVQEWFDVGECFGMTGLRVGDGVVGLLRAT